MLLNDDWSDGFSALNFIYIAITRIRSLHLFRKLNNNHSRRSSGKPIWGWPCYQVTLSFSLASQKQRRGEESTLGRSSPLIRCCRHAHVGKLTSQSSVLVPFSDWTHRINCAHPNILEAQEYSISRGDNASGLWGSHAFGVFLAIIHNQRWCRWNCLRFKSDSILSILPLIIIVGFRCAREPCSVRCLDDFLAWVVDSKHPVSITTEHAPYAPPEPIHVPNVQ